jgi:hypothetical protein
MFLFASRGKLQASLGRSIALAAQVFFYKNEPRRAQKMQRATFGFDRSLVR